MTYNWFRYLFQGERIGLGLHVGGGLAAAARGRVGPEAGGDAKVSRRHAGAAPLQHGVTPLVLHLTLR